MTNYEKMLELTGAKATKKEIKSWAYMNRVCVAELHDDEPFEPMKASVEAFYKSIKDTGDESHKREKFLDCEYMEV